MEENKICPHLRQQIFRSEAISLAQRANFIEKSTCISKCFFLVGGGGFEPPKALPADLQSVPIGHSGIPPNIYNI